VIDINIGTFVNTANYRDKKVWIGLQKWGTDSMFGRPYFCEKEAVRKGYVAAQLPTTTVVRRLALNQCAKINRDTSRDSVAEPGGIDGLVFRPPTSCISDGFHRCRQTAIDRGLPINSGV
nr:hypothetical protein [Granulosicoccus sp.]